MYIPVIPPTGKKGKDCSDSSPAQALTLAIGLSMFFIGIATAVYLKKGGSIGLMEMTILGAVVVLVVGAAFILVRPRSDEEPSKSKGPDNKPIQ